MPPERDNGAKGQFPPQDINRLRDDGHPASYKSQRKGAADKQRIGSLYHDHFSLSVINVGSQGISRDFIRCFKRSKTIVGVM